MKAKSFLRAAPYALILLTFPLANCASRQFHSLDRITKWSMTGASDDANSEEPSVSARRSSPVARRPRALTSEWVPDGCELRGPTWGSVSAVGHEFEEEVKRAAEEDMAVRALASGANMVLPRGLGYTIDSVTRYGYAFHCDEGSLAAVRGEQPRPTCREREFPLPPTRQHERWNADVGTVLKYGDCRLVSLHKIGASMGKLGVHERFQFPSEDCKIDLRDWERNVLRGDSECRMRISSISSRRAAAKSSAISILAFGISVQEETRARSAFEQALAAIDEAYGPNSQFRKTLEERFPSARRACQQEGNCDVFGTPGTAARNSPAVANRFEEKGAIEIDRLREQGRFLDAVKMSYSFARVGAFQDPGASTSRYLSRMARILLFDLNQTDNALKLLESSVDTLERLQADQKQPSFGFQRSYSVSDDEVAGIYRTLAIARALSGDPEGAKAALRQTCGLGGCGPKVLKLPYTQVQEHAQALLLSGNCDDAIGTLADSLQLVEKLRTRDARWADANLKLATATRACTGKLDETLLEKALHDQIALSLVNAGEGAASPAAGLGERLAGTLISWALEEPGANDRAELAFASVSAKKGALWAMKSRGPPADGTDTLSKELEGTYAELSRFGMEAIAKELGNPAVSQIWTDEHWKWRTRAEALERTRARQRPLSVREFVELQRQIPSALPRRSVAIEYVRYRPYSFDVRSTKPWGPPRYVAFVIHPSGKLRLIELGDAQRLEKRIDEFLVKIQSCPRCPTRGLVLTQAKAVVSDPALELFNDLLGPIRAELDASKLMLVSPDGAISRVPFAALRPKSDQVLLDTGPAIQVLPSTMQAIRRTEARTPKGLLVIGDPSYGPVEDGAPLAQFQELRFSGAESAHLARLWRESRKPVRELRGADARKRAVLEGGTYGLLHLATHGWFVPAPVEKGASYSSLSFLVPESAALAPPLIRSGLAFAGANGSPDGHLTALEVSGLNLSEVQLVVLSACQSARGEVAGDDGVFGLNRAFLAAGAQSVVSTLWDVADEATAAFMVDYHTRLLRGEDRVRALAESAKSLRKNDAWRDPWFWAPFMISGQDGAAKL